MDREKTFIDKTLKYWPLLVALIGLIIGYANFNTKIQDHEDRLTKNENRVEAFNPILLQIQKDIVEVKTKLDIYFKTNGQ